MSWCWERRGVQYEEDGPVPSHDYDVGVSDKRIA